MCIVLIKQTDYLLYKQLQRLSDDFMQNEGFSERMFLLRSQQRDRNFQRTIGTLRTLETLKTLNCTKKTLFAHFFHLEFAQMKYL